MTTQEVRQQGLDKFYTIPSVAETCIASVGRLYPWDWDLVVEPSAGNGSFLTRIPTDRRIGLDIAPEHPSIVQQDFFTYTATGRVLVIGNPPFGRVSSLAVKFFNHAANWASVIAFIIPKTFRRVSIQNRLHMNFHLVRDEELPASSFQPPMQVKCCFQIWERREAIRTPIALATTHDDWTFLPLGPLLNGQPTPPEGAHFAIRAYGGKCGEIVETGLEQLRPKSWHWIRANIDVTTLKERFAGLDYSISLNTARQNSIGRGELVLLYVDALDSVS